MANITSCLQLKPDLVVLLYSSDMVEQLNRHEEFLRAKRVRTEPLLIRPFDMEDVMSVCEGIVAKYSSDDLSLNVTGGTKIAALAAFQIFLSAGLKICYVNTRDQRIMFLNPRNEQIPITASLTVSQYLDLHGFRVESYQQDLKEIMRRRPVTEWMAGLAAANPRLIGRINGSFGKNADVEDLEYPYLLTLPQTHEARVLARKMCEHGLAAPGPESHRIIIPVVEIARYLRGFWFEEYVFLSVKSLPGVETLLNVCGRWETKNQAEPKNEFDVMAGIGNRLVYISCKTANVAVGSNVREYLYELDSLGDNALGLFGRKVLASARPIIDRNVRERAANMGIEIIDGQGILEIPERIGKWLNR